MAQATDTRTTSRDRVIPVAAFSPRPTASRPTVPRPVPVAPLRLAHATLIGALLQEQAEPIVGTYADPFDVTDRAEHLDKVFKAFNDYVAVIIADTADYVPVGGIETRYLVGLMKDTASDVVGSIMRSAEERGRDGR
jgi:hypothetical protein